MGNIGTDTKMNYTIIGDMVNLASRLEGLTKEYRQPLLISEGLQTRVKDKVPFRLIDSVAVKGKKQGVKIYTARRKLNDAESEAWTLHNGAMEMYYNRDFQGRGRELPEGAAHPAPGLRRRPPGGPLPELPAEPAAQGLGRRDCHGTQMSGLFEKAKAMVNGDRPPVPPALGRRRPRRPAGSPRSPPTCCRWRAPAPVRAGGWRPAQLTAGGEIVFDEDSGISKEDQKDILQEIEKAASENKLTAGPQAFVLHAERKGVFMPMLVNLVAVALLAVGGLVLYYFFQRGETTLKEETLTITSAEGKLIEQLKKEAEEKLLAKNREISQIQGQLSEIDEQRRDLAANMDAKVAAREQELRQGMEAALEQERQRLRRQGISEDDINRRLVALEAQKNRRVPGPAGRLHAAGRGRAPGHREQPQDHAAGVPGQPGQGQRGAPAGACATRAGGRTELKGQLAARTEALEAESQQARQELARISEQRDKEQLASNQLIGFYSRVKGDMQASMLDQALTNLEGIRQYLNDPAIGALPGIQQRREVEFFVVDSLASLVRGEMRKGTADTTSLVAAANLLTELRKRVQDGDALLARGGHRRGGEGVRRGAGPGAGSGQGAPLPARTGSGAGLRGGRRRPPRPHAGGPGGGSRPTRRAGRRCARPWPAAPGGLRCSGLRRDRGALHRRPVLPAGGARRGPAAGRPAAPGRLRAGRGQLQQAGHRRGGRAPWRRPSACSPRAATWRLFPLTAELVDKYPASAQAAPPCRASGARWRPSAGRPSDRHRGRLRAQPPGGAARRGG